MRKLFILVSCYEDFVKDPVIRTKDPWFDCLEEDVMDLFFYNNK